MKFIEITQIDDRQTLVINVDDILEFFEDECLVIVTNKGDEVYQSDISYEDFKRVLGVMSVSDIIEIEEAMLGEY